MVSVLKSPEYQDRYVRVTYADVVGNSPAEFKIFLAKDRQLAGELVQISGVKPIQ